MHPERFFLSKHVPALLSLDTQENFQYCLSCAYAAGSR